MSEEKKYINIEIGSRSIKLVSEESDEYLRAIAKYLNQKMADITGGDLSHPLYRDDNAILFSLNIADDLFKERTSSGSVAFDTDTLAKLESQEKEISVLNETITNLNNEKSTLTKDLANKKDEKSKLDECEKKLASLQGLYASVENQLEEKTNKCNDLETELIKTKSEFDNVQREYSSCQTRLTTAEKRVEEKTNYIAKLTGKINDKNQELNNLSTKLAEKNTSINELNQKSAERNVKLTNVNKERDDLAVKLKAANGNIRKLEEEIKNLKSESDKSVKTAKDQLTRVQEDYQTLLSDFENYQIENQTMSENQLQSAFAKTKAENIDLKRKVEDLSKKLAKNN